MDDDAVCKHRVSWGRKEGSEWAETWFKIPIQANQNSIFPITFSHSHIFTTWMQIVCAGKTESGLISIPKIVQSRFRREIHGMQLAKCKSEASVREWIIIASWFHKPTSMVIWWWYLDWNENYYLFASNAVCGQRRGEVAFVVGQFNKLAIKKLPLQLVSFATAADDYDHGWWC